MNRVRLCSRKFGTHRAALDAEREVRKLVRSKGLPLSGAVKIVKARRAAKP